MPRRQVPALAQQSVCVCVSVCLCVCVCVCVSMRNRGFKSWVENGFRFYGLGGLKVGLEIGLKVRWLKSEGGI